MSFLGPASRPLCVALALALIVVAPLQAIAQQPAPGKPSAAAATASAKDYVAVLDLEPVGASKAEATAMSERLREELLKTGRYVLVDRAQMNAVLDEQALQQTGCTTQECAVQVGKVLGVRKLITGKIIKIAENQWLVNATVVDVETTETQRAESLAFRGDYFSMLTDGIGQLAAKLSAPAEKKAVAGPAIPPAVPPPVQPAVPPASPPRGPDLAPTAGTPPAPAEGETKAGISKWWWIAGGVAVLGIAVAASSSKSSSDSSGKTPTGGITVSY